MAAAVRAGLVEGIFEAVRNAKRDTGGLAKLQGALSIPMQKRQSGGGAWQDELKNIARCLDVITGPSGKEGRQK